MTRFLAILLTIALLLAPIPVQAQIACGTRDSVVAVLDEKYGEVRHGLGLSGPKAIFELYANETTGTWTILSTTPNGWTCIMAIGTDWINITPKRGDST